MSDHFYSQFKDIYESDAKVTDMMTGAVTENLGKFQMNFVANGFDRDGMGEVLPASYDQSMLNRLLDGKAGEVSVTFIPKESGVYQFAVGAINPDVGANTTSLYPITTTIKFPH